MMVGVSIFGEVLFDCFPSNERVLGGAPFNVAWHLHAFRQQPHFVSRVGADVGGETICNSMQRWGMDCSNLQVDDSHSTGEVQITLQDGEPSYDIVDRVAYDFINTEQLTDLSVGILYHGSLALRHETSLQALQKLKAQRPPVIFMDVNLRDPWWQRDRVLTWVDEADWVKLNESEFSLLHGEGLDRPAAMTGFLQKHNLQGLVVTLGERGAVAVTPDQPAYQVAPVKVPDLVDTVGAGDAFSSVLLLGLNQGWPVGQTLERAQQFASALVGRRGATVDDPDFYQPMIDAWKL